MGKEAIDKTKDVKVFENGDDFEVTELSSNIGFTINLGDYESARVDQGMKVRLLKDYTDEEIKTLHRQLNNTLRKRVTTELKKIYNLPEAVRESL